MLVQNVQFLPASQLDLIRTPVLLWALDSCSVLAHARDLSLGEGAGVVLVQAALVCSTLTFIENPVV